MISKILIAINKLEDVETYRKAGITAFLFPLEGFVVGYNEISLEDILKVDVSNKFLLVNRILTSDDIDRLKDILKELKGIKGIVFEDVGVYYLIKELNLDLELLLFQNHFGSNSRSVKYWLGNVDSVFLCNELTYNELEDICTNNHDLTVHLFGYNQVMYSRRLLLSNWSENFNLVYKSNNLIEDTATHIRFRAVENNYGTVMYSDKVFNGRRLVNLPNVKYFYINTMMIDSERIISFINDLDINTELEDEGFLDKPTIYKIGRNK